MHQDHKSNLHTKKKQLTAKSLCNKRVMNLKNSQSRKNNFPNSIHTVGVGVVSIVILHFDTLRTIHQ